MFGWKLMYPVTECQIIIIIITLFLVFVFVQSDCIARISYEDGNVLGWVLLPNLRSWLLPCVVKSYWPFCRADQTFFLSFMLFREGLLTAGYLVSFCMNMPRSLLYIRQIIKMLKETILTSYLVLYSSWFDRV